MYPKHAGRYLPLSPELKLVGLTGLEPAHFLVPNEAAYQLAHSPVYRSLYQRVRFEQTTQMIGSLVLPE